MTLRLVASSDHVAVGKAAGADLCVAQDDAAIRQALQQVGERRRPRVDDRFSWHQDARLRQLVEIRRFAADLRRAQGTNIHPVRAGLRDDCWQLRDLVVRPSDDDGAGLPQRKIQPLMDLAIASVAVPYAFGLESVGLSVEPRMKQPAVALARAVEKVRIALKNDRSRSGEDEFAEDRAADDARADHRDVERARVR